jgi:hypothetical protein
MFSLGLGCLPFGIFSGGGPTRGRKKLPRCGGWFLPLPVLKDVPPIHRSAWLLAIFRRKLRVAILLSLSG